MVPSWWLCGLTRWPAAVLHSTTSLTGRQWASTAAAAATAATASTTSFPLLKTTVDCGDTSYREAALVGLKAIKQLDDVMKVLANGGGERARHRHVHVHGKLLVWERIKRLVDPGAPMLDLAPLAGLDMPYGDIPYGGAVCVIAKVRGRYCIINANDGTVKGGTYFPITVTKSLRAQQISESARLPSMCLVDSGGGFLPLQSELFPDKQHGGRTFRNQAVLSAAGIPQIAVVCGSCTAGGAYAPTMSDEAVMVDRIGTLFLGGPPLVRAALGEVISDEELGGASLHCSVSGCCDMFAADEDEAFSTARDVVESLNLPPAVFVEHEPPLLPVAALDILSGRDLLSREEVKFVMGAVLDASRFREFKPTYGTHLTAGFSRLGGRLVGVVANHGPLTARDATKLAHLVQLCDQRAVPLLFLQNSGPDSPEDVADPEVLRCRARAAALLASTRVPKISLCLTGCHGDQHLTMAGLAMEPSLYLAWPRARLTPLAMSAAADSGAHLTPSSPPGKDGKLAKPEKPGKQAPLLQMEKDSSLFYASRVLIDAVLRPSDTRKHRLTELTYQLKLGAAPSVGCEESSVPSPPLSHWPFQPLPGGGIPVVLRHPRGAPYLARVMCLTWGKHMIGAIMPPPLMRIVPRISGGLRIGPRSPTVIIVVC